jgi:hypothetical protein
MANAFVEDSRYRDQASRTAPGDGPEGGPFAVEVPTPVWLRVECKPYAKPRSAPDGIEDRDDLADGPADFMEIKLAAVVGSWLS